MIRDERINKEETEFVDACVAFDIAARKYLSNSDIPHDLQYVMIHTLHSLVFSFLPGSKQVSALAHVKLREEQLNNLNSK